LQWSIIIALISSLAGIIGVLIGLIWSFAVVKRFERLEHELEKAELARKDLYAKMSKLKDEANDCKLQHAKETNTAVSDFKDEIMELKLMFKGIKKDVEYIKEALDRRGKSNEPL